MPEKEESFARQLAVPIAILLVTALVSGLVVPMILGRIENERRQFELQSRLIEQIVGDDAAAQQVLGVYRADIAYYRNALIENELEARLLALRPAISEAERQVRRADLQQDLAQARTAFDTARKTSMDAISKSLLERRGNIEWVRLHYGDVPLLESYADAAGGDFGIAYDAVDAFAKRATDIYRRAQGALLTCPDEATCRKIAADATAQIEGGLGPLSIEKWEKANRDLVTFISRTKPRV